ncbi:MAG: hypothetical protein JJ913_12490 [Rhizobiaceae bacterium]|nr:hypothetical protein [Rhizobiaceae bacterium]
MPRSIAPHKALQLMETATFLDVRKEPARLESGETISGARRRLPGDVTQWREEFTGERVFVFCVHGHEVSQGVCDALLAIGCDAHFLEGGFEAWRAAGLPVERIGRDA